MNTVKKLGVVGCGFIMRAMYSPALLSLRNQAEVVAVCDLNEELAKSIAGPFGARVFTSLDAMLAEGGLDAVVVLTTEKANAPITKRVLRAGLPVYLEKPPAVNSAQLEELIAAESQSGTFVYSAFNRRHTPFYAGLDFGGKMTEVAGALRRKGRIVESFPYTAVHVIDAAQHFAGSSFRQWSIKFSSAAWRIEGRLENGVPCALDIVPDGDDFAEYLDIKTADKSWHLEFPNAAAAIKEGEIVVRDLSGQMVEERRGDPALPEEAAVGFRDCLQHFFSELDETPAESPHRLLNCRATIRIMEEMGAAIR